ncbi:MAG: hypothetical protein R6U64_06520 [Bacteroidales bacterium]
MRIILKTTIKRDFQTVVSGFNKELFEYLIGYYPLVKLRRYDGQEHGDMVHFNFGWSGTNEWKVVVKDSELTSKNYWFIHRGLTMPFGLDFWQHMHRVVALGKNKTAIIDYIQFESKWKWLNPLNFVFLYLVLFPQKLFYRRYYYGKFSPPGNSP